MFTLPPSTHDVQFKESMQSIIFPSPFPGPTHRRAPFLGTKTSRLVLWPLVGRCLSAMGRSVALDGLTISHHRIPEELGGGGGMDLVHKAEDMHLRRWARRPVTP